MTKPNSPIPPAATMTNEQADRLLDALESIAYDLKRIGNQLDPNARSSAATHLIDALNRFDSSGIESSLDQIIAPQLERIADRTN
jgi:hypothetical protein